MRFHAVLCRSSVSNSIALYHVLTHWGRGTHICFNKLTIIGSDNGLSPGWRQAIIWTNVGKLFIRTLGTNCSEIVIEMQTFSLKKLRLKMSSVKRQPFCLGLNVLRVFPRHSLSYEFHHGGLYLDNIFVRGMVHSNWRAVFYYQVQDSHGLESPNSIFISETWLPNQCFSTPGQEWQRSAHHIHDWLAVSEN